MPVVTMDLEQDKTPSQEEPASEVKRLEPPRTRRPRRDRAGPAVRLAGVQAIDRMAEAGRLLAEHEEAAARASSEPSVTKKAAVTPTPKRLPAVTASFPQTGLAALRRLPSNLPIYAAALCLAIGVGGLLGGQFGANSEVANADGDGERVERPLAGRRETADKTRDEIKGLRAELAALRINSEQLRQAENLKQTNELRTLRASVEAQRSEVASLKADLAARSERDAAGRYDKTAERIDRLERRLADPAPTATVTKAAAVVEAQKAVPESPKIERLPIPGITLRDVARGVALVETRRGLMEVMPGDVIPGGGRVETIEKHAGRWRVVTSNGVIDDTAD